MLPIPHLSCINVLSEDHTASQIRELISLLVPPLALFIFLGSQVSHSCGDEQSGTGRASTAKKCFVLSNRGPRLCLLGAGRTTLTSQLREH